MGRVVEAFSSVIFTLSRVVFDRPGLVNPATQEKAVPRNTDTECPKSSAKSCRRAVPGCFSLATVIRCIKPTRNILVSSSSVSHSMWWWALSPLVVGTFRF